MKMYSHTLKLCFVAAFIAGYASISKCHPQCLDFRAPYRPQSDFQICEEYQALSCCEAADVDEIERTYNTIVSNLSEADFMQCAGFVRDMLCQKCSPYAAHLYDTENRRSKTTIPGLCNSYCQRNFKCRKMIPMIENSASATSLASITSKNFFCHAVSASDEDYCFPELLNKPSLNDNIGTVQFYQNNSSCLKMCVKEVANELYSPVSMKHANDGTHRSFVTELRGIIWVYLHDWSKLSKPFLNITEKIATDDRDYDERGLLDIEFHPQYSSNGLFYVYYSTLIDNVDFTRISEMSVMETNMNRANHASERVLLEVFQPEHNHNGGQLLFGDDGYLYISIGDGGGAGDQFGEYGNGLHTKTFLGKILRIDVNGRSLEKPYLIPPSNPYIGNPQFLPEIYAYGIRNMWRCSKDRGGKRGRGRGRIFCGDVGQNKYEEIDIIKKGGNYGWRAREGFACYDKKMCKIRKFSKNLVRPIFAYSHNVGKSVTGGFVYRGCENPNWHGRYIFGDFMNGRMISLRQGRKRWYKRQLCLGSSDICKNDGLQNHYFKYIQSFGEDESGELYFMSTTLPSSTYRGGSLYKLVDPSLRGNPDICRKSISKDTEVSDDTQRMLYRAVDTQVSIRLVGNSNENQGVIEIYHDGQWGTICGKAWTRENSEVACRSLGFSGAESFNNKEKKKPGSRIWLDVVNCSNIDNSISKCSHTEWGLVVGCKTIVSVACEVNFFNK